MDLSSMIQLFSELGPNLFVLLGLQVVMLGVVIRAVLRVRSGAPVNAAGVLVALSLPLVVGVLAHTVQLDSAMRWAAEQDNAMARNTIEAMGVGRAIGSQLLGGLMSSATALLLVLGCALGAGPGARPQLRGAVLAAVLTWGLSVLLMLSGAAVPGWAHASPVLLTALRGSAYLAAGLATTLLLFTNPGRGPGTAGALLAGLAMPVLVAGADAALLAWIAGDALRRAATAPAAAKQSILDAGVDATQALSWYSWGYLALGLGIAGVALAATRNVSREDLPGRRWGMALASVSGVVAVTIANLWSGWWA